MIEIKTKISINATSQKVWDVLTNYASYSEWSSFFQSIDGKLKQGERLVVKICQPNGRLATFKPILLQVKHGRKIHWVGKFISRLFLEGEHYFELSVLSENKTELLHGEKFRGILPIIFRKFFISDTKKGFEMFNRELKNRIEHYFL